MTAYHDFPDEKLALVVADLEGMAAKAKPSSLGALKLDCKLSAALIECGRRWLAGQRRTNFPERTP